MISLGYSGSVLVGPMCLAGLMGLEGLVCFLGSDKSFGLSLAGLVFFGSNWSNGSSGP